jgi:hypothetical protein
MRLVDVDELLSKGYECVTEFDKWGEAYNCEELDELPTVNAIVIPENVTNGDMYLHMFPNAKVVGSEYHGVHDYIVVEVGNDTVEFPMSWWNAPYKKGE